MHFFLRGRYVTWDKMKMSSDKLPKICSYCYQMSWTDMSDKWIPLFVRTICNDFCWSLWKQKEERLSVVRYEHRLAL